MIDCIRHKIWDNRKVEWWYAQNIFLFAKEEYLKNNLLLLSEYENNQSNLLEVVHPRFYEQWSNYKQLSWKRYLWLASRLLWSLPEIVKNHIFKENVRKTCLL